jgi:hypothetical protein
MVVGQVAHPIEGLQGLELVPGILQAVLGFLDAHRLAQPVRNVAQVAQAPTGAYGRHMQVVDVPAADGFDEVGEVVAPWSPLTMSPPGSDRSPFVLRHHGISARAFEYDADRGVFESRFSPRTSNTSVLLP